MTRIILAAAVLALAACGLENTPVLDPPGPTSETTPGSATFHVNYKVTAIAEFRGFEVYYRFYSSDQPLQKDLGTLDDLRSGGFRRMCSPGTLDEQTLPYNPLIPVDPADRGVDFSTDLVFTLVLSPYLIYNASSPPPYTGLRRSVVDDFDETKFFDQIELLPTDDDLVGVNWTQVGNDRLLYMVAYAISYGLLDLASPLYSEAVYLGYISYNY